LEIGYYGEAVQLTPRAGSVSPLVWGPAIRCLPETLRPPETLYLLRAGVSMRAGNKVYPTNIIFTTFGG